jgi:hypothetical protein
VKIIIRFHFLPSGNGRGEGKATGVHHSFPANSLSCCSNLYERCLSDDCCTSRASTSTLQKTYSCLHSAAKAANWGAISWHGAQQVEQKSTTKNLPFCAACCAWLNRSAIDSICEMISLLLIAQVIDQVINECVGVFVTFSVLAIL